MLVPEDFGISVDLDNGCVISRPAIPRPLPAANCSLYSVTAASIQDYGNVTFNVTNADIYNANLTHVTFNWNYANQLASTLVYPFNELNADWFKWGTSMIWGSGDNGARDWASVTDTSVD